MSKTSVVKIESQNCNGKTGVLQLEDNEISLEVQDCRDRFAIGENLIVERTKDSHIKLKILKKIASTMESTTYLCQML